MPFIGKQPAEAALVTGDLGDDIVTLAKMSSGTDGTVLTYDASGNPSAVGPGSDGEVLTSTGAGSPPAFEAASGGGFTLGTPVATTSGSSVTFGSIPSGTTMVVVNFNLHSNSSASGNTTMTIGDAGGLETSSYNSIACIVNGAASPDTSTSAFILMRTPGAGLGFSGQVILTLENASSFKWSCFGALGDDDSGVGLNLCAGGKTLSAELTQLSVITPNTLDGGEINIMYQ